MPRTNHATDADAAHDAVDSDAGTTIVESASGDAAFTLADDLTFVRKTLLMAVQTAERGGSPFTPRQNAAIDYALAITLVEEPA